MSTLEATVSMLETLPEEDLMAINGIVRRFVVKESNPYRPLSKEETLEKLAKSRKHAEECRLTDARQAVEEIRQKHGI